MTATLLISQKACISLNSEVVLTTEDVLAAAEKHETVVARLHHRGSTFVQYKVTYMGDDMFVVESLLDLDPAYVHRSRLVNVHWRIPGKHWSLVTKEVADVVQAEAAQSV